MKSISFKKPIKKQIEKLKNFEDIKNNIIIEYPEHGFKELNEVCKKIRQLNGGALFIDYGYKFVVENAQKCCCHTRLNLGFSA